jgi:hypothetical protein
MNCERATELWSSYCENEIDAGDRLKLEEHLTRCRVCAEGLAAFQKTMRALKDLPPMEPSPSFDARLARALAEENLREGEPWHARLGIWCARLAPAAGAVAAVFAISFYLALQVAPVREGEQASPMRSEVAASAPLSSEASGPLSSDEYAASLAGRASVRVEPWSVAGQWPEAPADSAMSGYRVRFVLDKVILEGEEAARSSVPQESEGVHMKYVTF